MKVIRSRVLGYCFGVRRAVTMAWAQLDKSKARKRHRVFSLGPLIHNPQAVEQLNAAGMQVLPEEFSARGAAHLFPHSSIIIRAHGISPQFEAELNCYGAPLVDATCPRVKSNQLKAQGLAQAGYHIFLVGENNHAEVSGIKGYIEEGYAEAGITGIKAIIVSTPKEASIQAEKVFQGAPNAKTAALAQTTIQKETFEDIADIIQGYFPSLERIDTICGSDASESMIELCTKVEAVIVAGGRASANTRRLLEIARKQGKPAWLIEQAGELPPAIYSYSVVGLGAGASTPDFIIDEIEQALSGQ
ncbi:4-hydroxy-3-methylbut-2-enyl diphosphate reductase [Spirochaetia bacterium]|nr:4-hydroxy-3-methylbut-2-enyl diphosphate reductase [Spirochaetia bacterium]